MEHPTTLTYISLMQVYTLTGSIDNAVAYSAEGPGFVSHLLHS